MDLGDIVDFVCDKARYVDSESKTKCAGFVNRRYQMLWDKYLWKDSLYNLSLTFSVSDELNAAGIYLLPRITERIIAVRSQAGEVQPNGQEYWFRQDADEFAASGEPISWFKMPSVCAKYLTAKTLSIVATNAADKGAKAFVRWIDSDNEPQQQEFTLDTVAAVIGDVLDVVSFSKPTTTGAVHITSATGTELTLSANKTAYLPYTVLRLLRKPTVDTAVKVLVKKKFEPLATDYDEPLIGNLDNALCAFVQGDMLQRGRRYGQARDCYTEGQAMIDALLAVALQQEATNSRILPDVAPANIDGFYSKDDF